MGMEFREVTRGNQKIFIHLVPDEDESGIGFDAKSLTSAGHEVPARVIPAPEGVWVGWSSSRSRRMPRP